MTGLAREHHATRQHRVEEGLSSTLRIFAGLVQPTAQKTAALLQRPFRYVSDLFKILSDSAPNHYLGCEAHIQSVRRGAVAR
jgi:hypothetical protein